MKKKRIAFVHSSLGMGGIEKALIQLLKNLDMQKYDISLFLFWKGGVLEKEIPKEVNITYIRPHSIIHYFKKCDIMGIIRYIYIRVKLRFIRNEREKNVVLSKLYPKISKNQFDILVCFTHVLMPLNWVADQDKEIFKIVFIHMEKFDSLTEYYFMKLFPQYRHIVCVSNAVKDYICTKYPMFSKNIVVMHNLIDVNDVLEKSVSYNTSIEINHPAILSVGRLSEEKGFYLIPSIMKNLIDNGYNVYWYIIGEGSERERIVSMIQEGGVSEHVLLLGQKENPYPYMKECDIYVQPSSQEGFGITVAEAKIFCKPIVATDISAFRELIETNKTGILTPHDVQSFTSAICRLIDEPLLCNKFKSNLENLTQENLSIIDDFDKLCLG